MHVLAIDTALNNCAVAVLDATTGTIVASESLAMQRGHAESLMPLIARVLDSASLEFEELDRVAVTVGPGSFTGLRVGIAAARGIALATGKPVVGLSTFAAFAAPYIGRGEDAIVIAAIDARHDHVYLQVFESRGRTLVAPRVATHREAVRAATVSPAVLVGSGAQFLAAVWPPEQLPPLLDARDAPDIAWVARLGAVAEAKRALPKPFYLRQPDARPQEAVRLPRR
jgi:tRNA threonylcarbamoyladenosine biosynthesis protein TsaB